MKEILSPAALNKTVVAVEEIEPEEIPISKLEKGDFEGLRKLLTGKDRIKYMESLLVGIDNIIKDSQKEASAIKERGIFKRFTNNNVNDIGSVLSKQNVVIACLFLLMQMQSYSIEACNDMLAALSRGIDETSNDSTEQSLIIAQTFRDVLEDYKKKLEKDGIRDKALMKLLKAAENSKDFEIGIRAEVAKIKSEYSADVEKLYNINKENQKNLSDTIQRIKKDLEKRFTLIENNVNQKVDNDTFMQSQQEIEKLKEKQEDYATKGSVEEKYDQLQSDLSKKIDSEEFQQQLSIERTEVETLKESTNAQIESLKEEIAISSHEYKKLLNKFSRAIIAFSITSSALLAGLIASFLI